MTSSSNGARRSGPPVTARDFAAFMQPVRLEPADAVRFLRLRTRMLEAAPWAFSVDAGEGEALDVERLELVLGETNHATLALEAPPEGNHDAPPSDARAELIGTASITRARQRKFAHRARLWGVFVEPTYRSRGLGKLLIAASVELARSSGVEFVDLSVSASSAEAQRLYRSAGFTEWGREPEATDIDGKRYDELHMTLRVAR